MGWSFNFSHTKKQHVIDELLSPGYWKAGTKLLAHRSVGNNFWQVLQNGDDAPIIVVTLIQYAAADRCFGTKGLQECSGPVAVNCPLAFLDMAPEANSYGWRDRVRAYHVLRAERAAQPKPTPGTIVRLYGVDYRLTAPAGPRRGWYVARVDDGVQFRLKASQVAAAA
jgi:hypothetical protein